MHSHSHSRIPFAIGHSFDNSNTPTIAAVAGLALLANLAAASPLVPAGLALICLTVLAIGRGQWGALLRRMAIPWYLALVAVAVQTIAIGPTPIFQFGPITGYAEGLARGSLLAMKVVAGSAVVLALSEIIPPTEMLAIAARLHLPSVLVEVGILTYRYLFLLGEEAQRIHDAQALRLGHCGWMRSISSYSSLAGMLIISSYDRSQRVYDAMQLRGYDGHHPIARLETTYINWVWLSAAAAGLGLALWLGKVV